MKSIKNRIAISLVFVQLLASGLINEASALTRELVKVDNSSSIDVCMWKEENSDKLTNISIFDDENISSKQYGASQRVFRHKFDELINDPLIWEEMQKYYPQENYECLDDALYIYEKYFDNIYQCGCGYAAAADYVFHMFEGKELEFYEKFGFPMYTYKDGKLDYNYELFMLKFFLFKNYDMTDGNDEVMNHLQRDFYEYKALKLAEDRSYRNQFPSNVLDWTDEDYDRYDKIEAERNAKFKEYKEKKAKAVKGNYNSGITLNGAFGYLYIFLANHGVKINTKYEENIKKYSANDIIAADNFYLYRLGDSGEIDEEKDVDLHYIYVVEVDGNDIIVSSWGQKYQFENKPKSYVYKIKLTKAK